MWDGFVGAPSVYYGDEIGLPGTNYDPDTRRGMPWDQRGSWDMDLLAYHKQLIAMRNAHPALRTGAYHRLYADDTSYAFARADDGEALLVAANTGDEAREIVVQTGEHFAEGAELAAIYGTAGARVESGKVRISVPARDGVVLHTAR